MRRGSIPYYGLGTEIAAVKRPPSAKTVAKIVAELNPPPKRPEDKLTPHQRFMLALLIEGLTNDEIAVRSHVESQTVKNTFRTIFAKLGVPNRVSAAVYCLRYNVELPPVPIAAKE